MIAVARYRLGYKGKAKQRQKADLTPKKLFGSFRATRPGHLVMFDSTKLDMFALDPETNDWIQVALTIAYDFYSRSIVGWRFTPVDTKGVDAALILFDILHPKSAMPDWEDVAYWNYFGVPNDIRIIEYFEENSTELSSTVDPELQENNPSSSTSEPEIGSSRALKPLNKEVAGIPFVTPDTVLIDHGKVFVSRTFQDVCTRLGIHVQRSRVRRPTDKSPIENVFKQITQGFCQRLPGHKGRDVPSRGIDVEKKALYYIEEIDLLFAEWVATKWQNQTPRTLHYPAPGAVDDDVSPNDAYALGLTLTGFIPIPNLSYFDCLETQYRVVQDNGVTIQYLEYDSADLEPFRRYPSQITSGSHKGDYLIKADPRDRSQIFFFDEIKKTWIIVPWRGKKQFPHPFGDLALAYAKAVAIERLHGKKPTDDDIREALESMYARWDAQEFTTRRERRAFGRDKSLTKQAGRDQKRMSQSVTLHSPPSDPDAPVVQHAIPSTIEGVFKRSDQIKSIYEENDDEF